MTIPNVHQLTVSLSTIPAGMVTEGMFLYESEGALLVTSVLREGDKVSILAGSTLETFDKSQAVKLDETIKISVGDKLSDSFTVSAADIYILKILEDVNATGGITIDTSGSQDFTRTSWFKLSETITEMLAYAKSTGNPYACLAKKYVKELIPY